MNQVCLVGRLTADPEIRYTKSQTPVASFSLAIKSDFKGRDGERQVAFIPCVTWRHNASYMEKYAKKGRVVTVSGRIQMNRWKDSEGHNKIKLEVVAETVALIGVGKDIRENFENAEYDYEGFSDIDEDDGELPM